MTHQGQEGRRRSIRRAAQAPCIAVEASRFRLLGQRSYDLSCDGMLVESRVPVAVGDPVVVSFQTPGGAPRWMHARAEVARVVHGRRVGDRGCAVGLRFTDLSHADKQALQRSLTGLPPAIPQRALRFAGPAAVRDCA